ncbi:hypothetical protein [Streptomyces sp. NPDC090798]
MANTLSAVSVVVTPVAFAGEPPPSLGLDAAVGLVGACALRVVGPPGKGE